MGPERQQNNPRRPGNAYGGWGVSGGFQKRPPASLRVPVGSHHHARPPRLGPGGRALGRSTERATRRRRKTTIGRRGPDRLAAAKGRAAGVHSRWSAARPARHAAPRSGRHRTRHDRPGSPRRLRGCWRLPEGACWEHANRIGRGWKPSAQRIGSLRGRASRRGRMTPAIPTPIPQERRSAETERERRRGGRPAAPAYAPLHSLGSTRRAHGDWRRREQGRVAGAPTRCYKVRDGCGRKCLIYLCFPATWEGPTPSTKALCRRAAPRRWSRPICQRRPAGRASSRGGRSRRVRLRSP